MVVSLVEEILLPEYVQNHGIFDHASTLLGSILRWVDLQIDLRLNFLHLELLLLRQLPT